MKTLTTSLLQDLVDKQRQYVNHFFDTLDLEKVEKAFDLCMECQGRIVLTGVGKSGIIAEKIAMTLNSTGTRSLYLPAFNLLHGDIGAISSDDLIVILSKSGDTQELINLLPHLKSRKSRIIGVVSTQGSRLERRVDLTIVLPVEKELCPFDLAPTTSTVVQLLFGDILAMSLMKEKEFSLEEYAKNHPSGAIGRKITLTVSDLMRKKEELPLCKKEAKLIDVIVELSDKKCGCIVIVTDEGFLEGIFTDGDLRRALQSHGPKAMELPVEKIMTKAPIAVEPKELAQEALNKMQARRYVMVAPVVENGQVVGLIRMHDIIHEGI